MNGAEYLRSNRARDFAKQIKRAHVGNQSEVKPLLDGLIAPTEGQAGWRSTQIGIQGRKSRHKPRDIFRSASIDYVEIAC